MYNLSTETIEGTALPLESIDNIHGSNGFPFGVFSVGDSVTNDILQEHLENTTSFFINQARDAFHASTSCQTTNSGLGNTLDVITQDFAMTLSTSLPKSFASFAASSHVDSFECRRIEMKFESEVCP